MKTSPQTVQQIKRALRKVSTKFPTTEEQAPLTDILIQVKQESGELMVFDNGLTELTRCVIEDWIDNTDDDFYEAIQPILRQAIADFRNTWKQLNIPKPYSFVLINEEQETVADLYLVDDDSLAGDSGLMKDMNKDLDAFLDKLMKE